MTVPSSAVVMVPSPSLSNNEKASLNSEKHKVTYYRTTLILAFSQLTSATFQLTVFLVVKMRITRLLQAIEPEVTI